MRKLLLSNLGLLMLGAGLILYPIVLSDPFYRDIGVTFLLAAISASALAMAWAYWPR